MAKGKESKPHLGIYGRRNNGKSSLINQLANQDIAIVSGHAGTTTDPVKKSFEITGFGPVVLVDTAGIDDTGELGEKRISKTRSSIKTIDLGILIITHNTFGNFERNVIEEFRKNYTPFIVVHNKSDREPLTPELKRQIQNEYNCYVFDYSILNSDNSDLIIQTIKQTIPESAYKIPSLVGDLLSYGDIVLLITPIDIEAPAGRLILPQVQTIRDVLDNDAVSIILKEREVDAFLKRTDIKPKLAITDSQMFTKADSSVPHDVPLTSFSIVLARFKGDFENYLKGTPTISELKDGDRVLLLESCTHHVSCDDIGRIKIPRWITNFTGKNLEFKVVAGLNDLPEDIQEYALVIQCGGCMITRKQLINRIRPAVEAGVPVTNYGMAIAYVQGIYHRAIAPFISQEIEALDYL
ncbi:MAG: [FeFe] hydrogenase H-cluster maturation GTPase HydF [Bacteroidales bacterium]|nr:[FeFe] hydrogenase H-cluster maturation GTPase HydF [Bacteroidales bacterium]